VLAHTPGATRLPPRLPCGALAEQAEPALGRLVAELEQTRDRLLARRMLLAADNPAHLRLHQILLLQTPARVLCRAMEYFCLGTDRLLVHVLVYL
jgi:hypothetical protein